jgi:hypothetical protein
MVIVVSARVCAEISKSSPKPVKAAVCGLDGSESVTCRVAERAATLVGLKITLMLQVALTAKADPQVLVWEKSSGSAPAIVTTKLVSATPEPFVSVKA